MGGSVALAVRQCMPGCELRLWARRAAPLELARRLGITPHTYLDLPEAVRGVQLVILATPIGSFPALVEAMLPALSPGAVVTDVGSVKGAVHAAAGQRLAQQGICFIGSHPMAGGEKQGLEHARADLLQGATVALTNAHSAPAAEVQRLAAFWQRLGCRTCEFTPAGHDEAVARISHMPHVLAALCARAAMRGQAPAAELQQLASGGYRDTTRVSSGGADMWADILLSNAPAVCAALHDCADDLREIAARLQAGDYEGVRAWLEQARAARGQMLGAGDGAAGERKACF